MQHHLNAIHFMIINFYYENKMRINLQRKRIETYVSYLTTNDSNKWLHQASRTNDYDLIVLDRAARESQ